MSALAEPLSTPAARSRYSAVAIALHWVIAALIVLQIALGWRLDDAEGTTRTAILQLHKSVGITVLLLSLARLAWRLTNRPPEDTAPLSPFERRVALYVHTAFYGLMIALPLTGWAMISATRVGAGTRLFGVVPWPKLPLLPILPARVQEALANLFGSAHEILVWVILAALALHVAGALKHHLISRDVVLDRMAPGARPGRILEPRLLAALAGAVLLAGGAYALKGPPEPTRPPIANVAAADVYLDLVGPALIRRCQSCHNEDRARGGLSVVRFEDLMLGGASGLAVRKGAPAKSELYRRITLPRDHEDYMPADGKTPLNADQVKLIGWWISVGAPASGPLSSFRPSPEIVALAGKVLHLSGGDEGGGAALPKVAKGDADAIAALQASGYVVRPVQGDSNLLDVTRYLRTPPAEADLANLDRIRLQVRRLILRDTGLSDDALQGIGRMDNLAYLRIEANPGVTDRGVGYLAGLKNLAVLNLYGSKVTDAALATLEALPRLQAVHLWQTGVSEAGVARLRAAKPGLIVTTSADTSGPVPAAAKS